VVDDPFVSGESLLKRIGKGKIEIREEIFDDMTRGD
jgi:hypothetical protein